MMLSARPQFNSSVGIIQRAFDARTMAGLNGRRWVNGMGWLGGNLGESNAVSRPDLLASAEAALSNQGIQANCYEEVLYFPSGPVYNRICDPIGGGDAGVSEGYLGADIISRMSSGTQAEQDLLAKMVANDIANYNAGLSVNMGIEPEVVSAQTQAQLDVAKQHLIATAPGYAQYEATYAPTNYRTPEPVKATVSPATATQQQAAQTASGNGSAADRQPGTLETVGGEESVSLVTGMSTQTLMLIGLAAIGLMVAMKK